MKILVAVKRVIDPYVRIRVKADQSGVEDQHVKMSINPFDEIAIEEAVRLKEAGNPAVDEIILVSIGTEKCQESLRNGLALGADRAIHVQAEGKIQPLAIAKIFNEIIQEEQPDLVILGKQAIDGDHNQTGQMLAALLDWPQGTFASELNFSGEKLQVTREVDGGLETLELTLPCIITTDLRLNTPRYATLPNIMQAKAKPLATKQLSDFNVDTKATYMVTKVTAPKPRKEGIILNSVDELIENLKNKEQVI